MSAYVLPIKKTTDTPTAGNTTLKTGAITQLKNPPTGEKKDTTITLSDGTKKRGYIQNSRAYTEDGNRIPVGASALTGGGEFKRTADGAVKISDKTRKYMSKYFSLEQFKCHDGSEYDMDERLLQKLDNLQEKVGTKVKIRINSAYRSPEYNKGVKGAAKNSQHMYGKAVDIKVDGYSPQEVASMAKELGFTGIGTYSSFTHVDVRDNPAEWKGK